MNYLTRKIIHVDMDCFYVSASIRDKQHLLDQPVPVGHSSKTREVICTINFINLIIHLCIVA
ncbi:MAG: hypothetical protein ACRYE9_01940 [Janthinobacterium lividum]